jgi:N-acetylmuramic acid 6-phosphate etherase
MAPHLDEPRDLDAELDALETEAGGEPGAGLERLSTADLVRRMNAEDATVPAAVARATDSISAVVDAIAASLERGGRLVYVGAGTSGRIAVHDAAECESTFSIQPGTVVALIAGGPDASPPEADAAEDDTAAGRADVELLGIGADDVVVGVSASGRTPYVLAALATAAAAGATTACVVSVAGSELERAVGLPIVVAVGPEFLAGSTRLKAGTAQKLVLNMLSTISMIRLGKTFGNLMVDVAATNEKLRARVRRIVRTATGAPPGEVDAALADAGGDAKVAIVSLLARVDAAQARARLERARGRVHEAVAG